MGGTSWGTAGMGLPRAVAPGRPNGDKLTTQRGCASTETLAGSPQRVIHQSSALQESILLLLGSLGPTGLWDDGYGACSHSDVPLPRRLEEVPLEVLRQRESKWLDMLNNWDKWMAKKHKKVSAHLLSPGGREGQLRAAASLVRLRCIPHVSGSLQLCRPRVMLLAQVGCSPSSPAAAAHGCSLPGCGFPELAWLPVCSHGNC